MRREKYKVPTIREFLPLFDDSAAIVIEDEGEWETLTFKNKFELINGEHSNYLDARIDDIHLSLKKVEFIVDRGFSDEDGNPIIICEDKYGDTYLEYWEEGDC